MSENDSRLGYADLSGDAGVQRDLEIKSPDAPPPFRTNGSNVYEVVKDYNVGASEGEISVSPGWFMAVFRLSKPLTYSRKAKTSLGNVVSGAFERAEKPLIIFDDCIQMTISRTKTSHIKNLTATLKSASVNYLSANAVLPGDWIFAWCHNDIEKTRQTIKKVLDGKPANEFMDGLKFMGRVHSIRKKVQVNQKVKLSTYFLQAVGFAELDTHFYYDLHLATPSALGGATDIAKWMKQIHLDYTKFVSQQQKKIGRTKDNVNELLPTLIDIVIGKGTKGVNSVSKNIYNMVGNKGISEGKLVEGGPQATLGVPNLEEAPYSYIIPVSVAKVLGKELMEKSKEGVFGYSDILHLLVGVQQYDKDSVNKPSKGFWPVLDTKVSTWSRSFCPEPVKGTYVPQNPGDFINKPLWSIFQQFLNPSINEMYTALKVSENGNVIPTLVVRQIPLSTNSIPQNDRMLLTRFLDLPRWKIDPVMIKDFDIGRSNGTRFNMVKILGDANLFGKTGYANPAIQETLNPPVWDTIDIARSGLKPYMQIINCTLLDLKRDDGIRMWTEAVADWTIGSQYTLNGQIDCVGIQTPIAEGDNLEFEDIVYHIEAITDTCSITPDGHKSFITSLSVTYGMPANQNTNKGKVSQDFPKYPGFSIIENYNSEKPKKEKKTGFDYSEWSKDAINALEPISEPEPSPEDRQYVESDISNGNDEELTKNDPYMTEER